MMWSRVIPLIVVLILALLVLVLVLHQRRKNVDTDRRERLAAEKRWKGNCEFDNPYTGAKCTRQEFHLENHYREMPDGELIIWP